MFQSDALARSSGPQVSPFASANVLSATTGCSEERLYLPAFLLLLAAGCCWTTDGHSRLVTAWHCWGVFYGIDFTCCCAKSRANNWLHVGSTAQYRGGRHTGRVENLAAAVSMVAFPKCTDLECFPCSRLYEGCSLFLHSCAQAALFGQGAVPPWLGIVAAWGVWWRCPWVW